MGEQFAACPTCRQYSHSIGEDQLAEALLHFESMYAHPVRGHPMGHHFDDATRNAAQVLMAAARRPSPQADSALVEALTHRSHYKECVAILAEHNVPPTLYEHGADPTKPTDYDCRIIDAMLAFANRTALEALSLRTGGGLES